MQHSKTQAAPAPTVPVDDDPAKVAARLLGRRGGLARARNLSHAQIRAIGRMGAVKRYANEGREIAAD